MAAESCPSQAFHLLQFESQDIVTWYWSQSMVALILTSISQIIFKPSDEFKPKSSAPL